MKQLFLVLIPILILSTVVGILATTDIGLYLRSQAAPLVDTDEATGVFAWTPPIDFPTGDYTATLVSTDSEGNETTHNVAIEVLPADALTLVSSEITTTASEATAIFTTSEAILAAAVEFDPRRSGELRGSIAKVPTDINATHTINIPNLLPCTRYRLVMKGNTVGLVPFRSSEQTFTTKGCVGDATVLSHDSGDITAASGGSFALASYVTVAVPAGATANDFTGQITQLERSEAIEATGSPADREAISGFYELSAAQDATTSISTFEEPLTVTLAYTPAEDTNEDTLKLFRWDGSAWNELTNCAVDTGAKTVACETSAFSVLGAFGEGDGTDDPPPAPTPTPPPPGDDGGGDDSGGGGGDGGGGGGGGGGGDDSAPEKPATPSYSRTINLLANRTAHRIQGTYSGLVTRGNRQFAKLAHPQANLYMPTTLQAGKYDVSVTMIADKPGATAAYAFYISEGGKARKAAKVFKTPQNDNRLYTYSLGTHTIRQSGAVELSIRPITDKFGPSEDNDLNGFIYAVTLKQHAGSGGGATAPKPASRGGGATCGHVAPIINSSIRTILGTQFVTPDINNYYLQRTNLPSNHRAALCSQKAVEDAMNYWKNVRPSRPRGDDY